MSAIRKILHAAPLAALAFTTMDAGAVMVVGDANTTTVLTSTDTIIIATNNATLTVTDPGEIEILLVGGDRTQNVLWRLDHGEMDGYRTRFVSLMIGTNNDDDPPEDRAEGIRAILAKMARRLPDATILLHPIFPRGAAPDDPCRVSRERTNAVIRRFADGGRVVWLDFNARFLQPDGTLSAAMMPDFLHPLEEGYRIWAEALRPFLALSRPS